MDRPDGTVGTTYVQVASHVMFDGSALTLLGLAPATASFATEPEPCIGYLPTGLFLDRWYAEGSGSRTRSVPAVLSFLDADRRGESDVDVTISLPRIRGTGVQYQAHVVSGRIPDESGAAVLFISPAVVPDTPAVASRFASGRRP
jgi:hypothetical protein